MQLIYVTVINCVITVTVLLKAHTVYSSWVRIPLEAFLVEFVTKNCKNTPISLIIFLSVRNN